MTKERCVDDSCATPTVRTLHTRTVCCSLPAHYSTYISSSGEAARYKAKALVTDDTLPEVCSADTTLLAGLLIVLVMYLPKCTQPLASLVTKPRPTNHTSQCVIRAYTNTWPDVL